VTGGALAIEVRVLEPSGPPRVVHVPVAREACSGAAPAIERAVRGELALRERARELVEVVDASRCVEPVEVARRLLEAVGEDRSRRLAARVVVEELDRELLLSISAEGRDGEPWVDHEGVSPAECATTPALVADSVLSGIDRAWPPSWSRLVACALAHFVEGRVGATATRMSAYPAYDAARDTVTRQPLATSISLQAGGGLRYEGSLPAAVSARIGAYLGPAFVLGVGYPEARLGLLPAVTVGPGVDLELGPGALLVADVLLAPVPAALVAGEDRVRVPVARIDLGVAFRP
jgi:hypothetical protein